jgi:ATP-binding cassette subfamily F protein uup
VAQVKKSKLSFKETKELETLELEIVKIEDQLKSHSKQLDRVGIDNDKLNDLLDKIAELNSQMDEKSTRWLTLSELKES